MTEKEKPFKQLGFASPQRRENRGQRKGLSYFYPAVIMHMDYICVFVWCVRPFLFFTDDQHAVQNICLCACVLCFWCEYQSYHASPFSHVRGYIHNLNVGVQKNQFLNERTVFV